MPGRQHTLSQHKPWSSFVERLSLTGVSQHWGTMVSKGVIILALVELTVEWKTPMWKNSEAYDLKLIKLIIRVPFVIYRALCRSCCQVFLSLLLIFINVWHQCKCFALAVWPRCTEPSALRSSWCVASHASRQQCVVFRTQLATVLPLGRKQPTQRAERKLWLGKIHKAARLGHWRSRQLS